jgi:hypothetical protein
MTDRGKPRNKVVVAIARELVGFLWATLAVEEVVHGQGESAGGMSTVPRRRETTMRRQTPSSRCAILESVPSRRSTVMRLCPGQPANIRVTRRRSDLVPSATYSETK